MVYTKENSKIKEGVRIDETVTRTYVIPHGTVIRQNFETMYKNKKKNTSAENVMLQVDKGTIAYIQHYDNNQ